MNVDTPVVTVVIPCFNMGRYLPEAVESVLAQTYREFEIVVIDDGSDDPGTRAVLDVLRSQRITVLVTAHGGVAAARNCGIRAARGRYVLPLDADDILHPLFLEEAVPLMEGDSEIGVVGCDARLSGAVSGIRRLPDFSRTGILSENLLFNTSLFRKSDWERAGGYCTSFVRGWEDWDFWIALSRRPMKVARIPEPLFEYRIRQNSRDRSMSFCHKLRMLGLILCRHADRYIASPGSLLMLVANTLHLRKRS